MNDRRQAPRRQEELTLHVTEMTLAAAALKVARAWRRGESSPLLLAELERAATMYETAEMEALAARQVVAS